MITYRPGTLEDVAWIAPRMRAPDVAEVWAASGLTPEVSLRRSVEVSTVTVCAEVDGEPAGLFGLAPISVLAGEAAPWMLATDVADQHARAWLRDARQWLVLIGDGWRVLRNHVDARNTRSQRWLRRMGFEVGEPTAWGYAGLPFREFRMEVGHV